MNRLLSTLRMLMAAGWTPLAVVAEIAINRNVLNGPKLPRGRYSP
jgi:hypothetical protein